MESSADPGVSVGIALGAENPDDEDDKPSRLALRRRARIATDGPAGFYGVAYHWQCDVSEATTALDEALRRAYAADVFLVYADWRRGRTSCAKSSVGRRFSRRPT